MSKSNLEYGVRPRGGIAVLVANGRDAAQGLADNCADPGADVVAVVRIDALLELREAWINTPFDGVVPAGAGGWLQPLINAVTAIVDGERTLRDDPDVRQRGTLASFKSQLSYADEQVKVAIRYRESGETAEDGIAQWTQKRADIIAACKQALGVDLEVSP